MSVRQTSIDCYNQIKAQGLLSKKRMEVYEVLFRYGNQTGSQIALNHRELFGNASTISETIRNRVTELLYLGVVEEVAVIQCPITKTKRNVIQWGLTDNLPKKYEKLPTTKEKIAELRSLVSKLEENTFDMFHKNDLQGILTYIDDNFARPA